MVDVSKGTQLYQGRWRWLGILAHDHSGEATGASFKGLGPRYWGSESSWVQEGSARAVSHQNCTRRIDKHDNGCFPLWPGMECLENSQSEGTIQRMARECVCVCMHMRVRTYVCEIHAQRHRSVALLFTLHPAFLSWCSLRL